MNDSISHSNSPKIKSRAAVYLQALRFRSWIGWVFIFGIGSTLFAFPSYNTFPIAISFSSITAAVFVVNQYFDRKSDTLNPQKKNLPIASGELSTKFARVLCVSLLAFGFFVTTIVDISLVSLFIPYIGLWIVYSTPPLHLKKRPVLDLLVAGVGSGILPFMIGLQVSHQLTMEFQLPWIQRRYLDAFLATIPIFLFQVSSHIFQAMGDYEADREDKITTFVVKYGKEKSAKIGTLFFSLSSILPIIYGLFNPALAEEFVYWYLLLFLISLPFAVYLLNLFRNPTRKNIDLISRISYRIAPFLLVSLYVCMIILRAALK